MKLFVATLTAALLSLGAVALVSQVSARTSVPALNTGNGMESDEGCEHEHSSGVKAACEISSVESSNGGSVGPVALCGGHGPGKQAPTAHDQKPKAGDQATCPVMKHPFKVSAETVFSRHKGKFYVFCCPACKPKFDANPDKYLGQAQK